MKIDRLIGILTLLLQTDKMTAPALAERFEVSRRTIMRDIETLCQAGIPIVTTQGIGGGISIMAGYKINKNILTSDELQHLIAALKGIDSVSKSSNLEQLLLKLAPDSNSVVSIRDHIVIDLSSHYKYSLSEKIEIIKYAITESKKITFDYYYTKGEEMREIEPYFIEFRWSSWYVFGWCCSRRDFRRFKLNRLWHLALTEEYFTTRSIPEEKANASDAFPDPYKIDLLFDKSVRFRLIEEYGPDCYEEVENGLLMHLPYTNKQYIFSWLLGFGDKAELLSPQHIRAEFLTIAVNIIKKYQ